MQEQMTSGQDVRLTGKRSYGWVWVVLGIVILAALIYFLARGQDSEQLVPDLQTGIRGSSHALL